jgi:uncharacterized membrane protein
MAEQETRPPDDVTSGDGGGTDSGNGARETVLQELRQAMRDAALEVLGPAARQATLSAASYAVKKGPEVVARRVIPGISNAGGADGLGEQLRSKGLEALSQMGGIGGFAGKLLSKFGGRGKGGGAASGWGHGRRMPIQQFIYVSVPVRHAYDGWTEYKQWPRYLHRANQVDAQMDEREARVKVTEKMWGFKRPFTAQVVTQQPDRRIKWNATEGVKHTGVINFHEIGPRLTLVEVNVDHAPSGILEKIARGARFVKRAVRADFHRYQAWIEMKDDDELAALEGWRGTVEDGQIITTHEDALEEERREEEGEQPDRDGGSPHAPEAGEREEPEAGEREEPEAGEREEPEAVEREEPEAGEREEPEAGDEEQTEAAEHAEHRV